LKQNKPSSRHQHHFHSMRVKEIEEMIKALSTVTYSLDALNKL
jgi:hypothetical protein